MASSGMATVEPWFIAGRAGRWFDWPVETARLGLGGVDGRRRRRVGSRRTIEWGLHHHIHRGRRQSELDSLPLQSKKPSLEEGCGVGFCEIWDLTFLQDGVVLVEAGLLPTWSLENPGAGLLRTSSREPGWRTRKSPRTGPHLSWREHPSHVPLLLSHVLLLWWSVLPRMSALRTKLPPLILLFLKSRDVRNPQWSHTSLARSRRPKEHGHWRALRLTSCQ